MNESWGDHLEMLFSICLFWLYGEKHAMISISIENKLKWLFEMHQNTDIDTDVLINLLMQTLND